MLMEIAVIIISFLLTFFLIFFDLWKKINLMKLPFLTIYFIAAPNVVLGVHWFYQKDGFSEVGKVIFLLIVGVFLFYIWLRLQIFPRRRNKDAGLRLHIMMGGRFLAFRGIYALFLVCLFYLLTYWRLSSDGVPWEILLSNAVFGLIFVFFTISNGALRMFFASRRLSVIRRVIMLLSMWIPVVNLIVLSYAAYVVKLEYDFSLHKKDIERTRAESDMCNTQYPFVMVHGILFRDLKYFNYWGRIPKVLKKRGFCLFRTSRGCRND